MYEEFEVADVSVGVQRSGDGRVSLKLVTEVMFMEITDSPDVLEAMLEGALKAVRGARE